MKQLIFFSLMILFIFNASEGYSNDYEQQTNEQQTMEAKIHLITGGSYSDYRIYAAFSTEENAIEYLSLKTGQPISEIKENGSKYEYYIESFPIDTALDNRRLGLIPFDVWVSDDNNNDAHAMEREVDSNINYNEVRKGFGACAYSVYVWAKDEKGAIKIGKEKIMQYIALNT